jgi:hypothetical protein
MTAAPEVMAEKAAWERYRSYVESQSFYRSGNHGRVFRGDEASHGLWREWMAARAERDKLSCENIQRRRHRQYRWPK